MEESSALFTMQSMSFVVTSSEWLKHSVQQSLVKSFFYIFYSNLQIILGIQVQPAKDNQMQVNAVAQLLFQIFSYYHKKRYFMEQDLLLLQILKVPVIINKFLAKTLSILTYLPNYLLLRIVDHFLFSKQYSSTLLIYAIMWLPKIVLLVVALSTFCLEFYAVYYFLELQNHDLWLKIGGVTLALTGLLILMRKGYLSMIEKYNLNKLKSVKQHFELCYFLLIDILSIFLTITNMLLLVNMGKTFSYEYRSDSQYKYLKHIFDCVRESIIIYVQFFYVKVFFKAFPWRFKLEEETYKKEKSDNNVLNCLVLLTITYIFTINDLFFISTFGFFNLIHYKRTKYLEKLNTTHIKWKVAIQHFGFAFLQTLQIIAEVLMFPICWSQSKLCLKMLINQHQNIQDLFGSQFRSLLVKCIIRVPFFICNIFIFVLQYKFKRRNMLVEKFRQKNKNADDKEFVSQNQLILEYKTFQCFAQQTIDVLYLIPIVLATLLKPWKIRWVKYLIDSQYQLQRVFVLKYVLLSFLQLLFLPILFLLNALILIYRPKKPFENYKQTKANLTQNEVFQRNKKLLRNQEYSRYMQMWLIADQSLVFQYLRLAWSTLKDDLPHLPLYFLLKATLLSIYSNKLQPKDTPSHLYRLYGQYYYLNVAKSSKGEYYLQMCNRMKEDGKIRNQQENTLFWKKAHGLERIILIQKIICLFLTNRMIEKIKSKVQKGSNLSEISNQYWYQYQLMKAFFLKFVYLVVEIIVSLIGFLFLLPLTLWRLPTFIKIYSHHNDKNYFFTILFSMYKQMFNDLKYLPLKILSILIAPITYLKYVKLTAYKYGPMGIEGFQKYQNVKKLYFLYSVFVQNLAKILSGFQILFIYLTWIRIKSLRVLMRRKCKWELTSVLKQYIFKSSEMLDLESIYSLCQRNEYPRKQPLVSQYINGMFAESLADFPYLIIIALLLILMPWRINYILQAIRDTRDDSGERKAFLRLFKSIFKDYACIFLNILLLLSGFKTSKALLLIKRNYRLNFFIGFLQYSYFQQLQKELIALAFVYLDVLLFFIACLFGWTRAHIIVRQLKDLYYKEQAQKEEAAKNKKIFQNTSNKKQLQLINRMGFYNYLNVCSYLSIIDIISLRKVDKLNYQMTKREEVWFTKWETVYTGKHNLTDEEYEIRCKKAFGIQSQRNPRVNITYHLIIQRHFQTNLTQQSVDIATFCKQVLPQRQYNFLFKDYRYQLHQGYGPQNELPQNEVQDEQFLRMTNQIRRPKVELGEAQAYLNWLFFKPVEKIVQFMHRYYRVNTHRRLKQILLVLAAIATVLTTLVVAFRLVVSILWLQDSLIGLRLVLIAYITFFWWFTAQRVNFLLHEWVTLFPFDIYYDLIKAWQFFFEEIFKKRMVDPTTSLLKKVGAFIKKIWLKVVEKISAMGQKTVNFTVKYSVLAYQKVIKPLYLKVADIIRKIRDSIVFLFTKIYSALKSIVTAVYTLISSIFKGIYNAIHAIFQNANKLYYNILKVSMTFLLKFGLIGNLLFTILGLVVMTLPTLIWWQLYSQRWYLIVSSIHTMVLIVMGYKHLQRIKQNK